MIKKIIKRKEDGSPDMDNVQIPVGETALITTDERVNLSLLIPVTGEFEHATDADLVLTATLMRFYEDEAWRQDMINWVKNSMKERKSTLN